MSDAVAQQLPFVLSRRTYTVDEVITCQMVAANPLMAWATFRDIRARGCTEDQRQRDLRKYGKCRGCRRDFADDDPVYIAMTCRRNGKVIGNRLVCADCAARAAAGG